MAGRLNPGSCFRSVAGDPVRIIDQTGAVDKSTLQSPVTVRTLAPLQSCAHHSGTIQSRLALIQC
jgi:hypothetical protein